MCQLLAVSRSGYYAWLEPPPSTPANTDPQLQEKVQRSCAQGRGTYGTHRIQHLLAQEGLQVSRRRMGRVLAQEGLRCKTRRRCKAPSAAGQAQTVAPNQLRRELTMPTPHTVYGGDMMYLPTGAGWVYLAVVLALGPRAVVGWSMADHMRTEWVNQALGMAIDQRRPAAGLSMHTDRGSQDGADSARQLLTQHAISPVCAVRGTVGITRSRRASCTPERRHCSIQRTMTHTKKPGQQSWNTLTCSLIASAVKSVDTSHHQPSHEPPHAFAIRIHDVLTGPPHEGQLGRDAAPDRPG
jgi:transposase InsO family protein